MLGSRCGAVKREEQPDARNARSAGRRNIVEPIGGDAANGQNGRSRRANNRSKAFEAQHRVPAAFDRDGNTVPAIT